MVLDLAYLSLLLLCKAHHSFNLKLVVSLVCLSDVELLKFRAINCRISGHSFCISLISFLDLSFFLKSIERYIQKCSVFVFYDLDLKVMLKYDMKAVKINSFGELSGIKCLNYFVTRVSKR